MVKKSLIIILAVFALNIVIVSCCTETFIISGLEFVGVRLDYDGGDDMSRYFNRTDTLTDRIVFEIGPKYDFVAALAIFQNPTYALSCGMEYQNSLLETSYAITSNQTIVVEGDSVKIGENWLANDNVKKYARYFKNSNNQMFIELNDDFKDNSLIENGEYRFYFECETSDNKTFMDSVDVVMNLN